MKFALLFLALSLGACATAAPPAQPETVGTLSASYNSIAVAPVAPSTDLARGSFVASDDDEPVAAAVVEDAAAPDVAAKGGLVMGGAR